MRLKDKVAIVVGAGQSPGEGVGNGRSTALTFGRINVVTLGANNTQSKATLVFLHAFVKRGGRWQLVAHQSAKLPA